MLLLFFFFRNYKTAVIRFVCSDDTKWKKCFVHSGIFSRIFLGIATFQTRLCASFFLVTDWSAPLHLVGGIFFLICFFAICFIRRHILLDKSESMRQAGLSILVIMHCTACSNFDFKNSEKRISKFSLALGQFKL